MTERGPLEILRQLAEREAQRITPPTDLKSEIRDLKDEPSRRRPRCSWRTGLVALAVIAVGIGGVATAGWLLSRPSASEDSPACRTEASLDADLFVLGVGDDPIESCTELWAGGLLPNPADPLPPGQPVPPLTACIGSGGAIEVYPATAEICEELGLPAVDPEPGQIEQRVVQLEGQVTEEINAAGCQPSATVVDQVEVLLAEFGFSDWQIRMQPSGETTPCAKAAVDSTMSTVWILHVPEDL